MAATAGRSTRAWKKLAATLMMQWQGQRRPCIHCAQPIDYDLDRYHPDGPTADHIKPLSLYPQYAEDPGNLGPAHRRCNSARGDRRYVGPAIGETSRNW